jgi:hypothetical protein
MLGLWLSGIIFIAHAMRRPPEEFSRVMKHVPGPAFMLIPFETLWKRARAGTLEIGQPAPDFKLTTTDHSKAVSLADLRGRPVVLIFGSYT